MFRTGAGRAAEMLLFVVLTCGGRGLGIGLVRRRLVLGRLLVCLGSIVGWRRQIGSTTLV